MNKTIADMITRIRNANAVYHKNVFIPGTKMTRRLAKLLLDEGLIVSVEEYNYKRVQSWLILSLRYHGRAPLLTPMIRNIQVASKSSLRCYTSYKNIPAKVGNFGTVVLSTTHGLLTEKQARKEKVGGEILCYIWTN
jgi:small subunit ribosomal protein S8